jgi:uncharacterized membrane protein YdjX (TVP38/TMEM64 family)
VVMSPGGSGDGGPESRLRQARERWPAAVAALPVLSLVLGILLVVGLNPGLRAEFLLAWGLLWDGEPEALRSWLLSHGAWAPVLSVLLQVATSVFPPGPSFLLAIANAMVFGAFWGSLLTLGSAILAAAICFGIARVIGRPGVERIVAPDQLRKVDRFMDRRGLIAVFLGRLIPFINPDLVSYAAGVTRIGWVPFLVAMTLGTLPSTAFYTLVGATAMEATGWVVGAVAVGSLGPLLLLVLFRRRFMRWRRDRERPREGPAHAEGDPDTTSGNPGDPFRSSGE